MLFGISWVVFIEFSLAAVEAHVKFSQVEVCVCVSVSECLGRVMTCMQLQSSRRGGSKDQDHFKEDCRWSNAKSKLFSQKSVTSVTAKTNKQKLPFKAHHISLGLLFAQNKNCGKVFTLVYAIFHIMRLGYRSYSKL